MFMAVTSHRSQTRTLSTSELLLSMGVTVLGTRHPWPAGVMAEQEGSLTVVET